MASYVEEVESLFLSAVRKGLSLRMGDLEIVRDWEKRGVPVEVVSRGILTGIRKFLADAEPSAPVPAGLRYYRTAVEREFDVYQRAAARGLGTVVSSAAPPSEKPVSLQERARQILAGRISASTGACAAIYEKALATFNDAAESAPLADLLFQIEDILVTELGQTLSADEFNGLKSVVETQTRAAADRGVGRRAVEDLRRNLLRRVVAEKVGFRSFLDEVLEKPGARRKN